MKLPVLKIIILLISFVSTSHVLAQNEVVIIPMVDTKIVFSGVGKTGDLKCSAYVAGDIGVWVEKPCNDVTAIKGQDADIQAGAAVTSPPRYLLNGDGTVTDKLTGLIWLENANCAGESVDWASALQFVLELNTSGKMKVDGSSCGDISNVDGSTLHQNDWRYQM